MATAARATRPKIRYELRDGFRVPVKGEVVGKRIEALKRANGGAVRPRQVVDDARPEDAPLHPCFEWDDAVAAELHRDEQARYLIRSYSIITENPNGEDTTVAIANVCVTTEDDERCYVSSARAMDDDELRQQVIDEAERLLVGVARRYEGIPGLRELFRAAVDRLEVD